MYFRKYVKTSWFDVCLYYNHDKSLGTLLHFWGVFQFSQVQPLLLTPQTMLDACIDNFFRVSTLYRVWEGELPENFEKDALF